MTCADCGGTILEPSRAGVERGNCYCPKPGRIIARLNYRTSDVYAVEWQDAEQQVDPPTLARAWEVLNELRAAWRASQGNANV